jgi:pyrrolidone-carboxylate peptidase
MSTAPILGLVTAFRPFLGRAENQSEQVLRQAASLPNFPRAWSTEVWPAVLPELAGRIDAVLVGPRPQVWLALGEAREEGLAELETLAHNAFELGEDAEAAAGGPTSGALEPHGPAFVRAHWPAAGLAASLTEAGFAVQLSQDAGRHCCNGLLWLASRAAELGRGPRPWIGFLHLPRQVEQRKEQAELLAHAAAWLAQQHANLPHLGVGNSS